MKTFLVIDNTKYEEKVLDRIVAQSQSEAFRLWLFLTRDSFLYQTISWYVRPA